MLFGNVSNFKMHAIIINTVCSGACFNYQSTPAMARYPEPDDLFGDFITAILNPKEKSPAEDCLEDVKDRSIGAPGISRLTCW